MPRKRPKDHAAAQAFQQRVLSERPMCDVWTCVLPSQVAHHVSNRSMGKRDHDGPALALCHDHHTGRAGVHVLGNETFARRFFDCSFAELVEMLR